MANTKQSLTEQNTQTYPSNTSGSITALAVKSFNNNFINAVATLGDENVFTEPQTFGDVVQVNSDVIANNVYAGNIPYLSGSNVFTGPSNVFSGSVTIQNLIVDTIVSSSTIVATGSNTLGDAAGDIQTLWGTVNLPTGPLQVTGSVSSTGGFTGSLQGTASVAVTAVNAQTASVVTTTGDNGNTAHKVVFVANGASAGEALLTDPNDFTYNPNQNLLTVTASYANYAVTASHALNIPNTSTFATTGSNTFNGDQNIVGSITASGALLGDPLNYNTIDIPAGGNVATINQFQFDFSGSQINVDQNTSITLDNNSNLILNSGGNLTLNPGAEIYTSGSTTGSVGQVLKRTANGIEWQNDNSGSTINTGSLLTTASAVLNTITFTKGDASTFNVTIDTGSGGGGGMNLGANTFTGSQTLSSSTIPASLIFNVSGALASFLTESNAITTTNTGYGNIIFNQRVVLNLTGSSILSGSSNIIFDAGTATNQPRGFNGAGNIGLIPIYSGSIPSGVYNYFGGTVTSSGSKQQLNQNNIIGSITLVESNNLSASFANNYVNGVTLAVNTNYSGSTGVFASTVSNNTLNGASHLIQIAGSGSQNRQFANNLIGGAQNTASLTTATGSSNNSGSLLNTLIYGTGLIVSGTQINTTTLHGGAFIGRFNETGSLADNSVVFAIGAGTSNTNRNTPFYVSSSGEVILKVSGSSLAKTSFKNNTIDINGGWVNSNTLNGNATVLAGSQVTVSQSIGSAVVAAQVAALGGGFVNSSTTGSLIAAQFSGGIGGASWTATIGNISSTAHNTQQVLVAATSASFASSSVNSAIIAGGDVRMNNGNSTVALGRDAAYTASAAYTLYTQNINTSGSINVTGSIYLNGVQVTAGGGTGSAFPYSGSAEMTGSLAVSGTFDTRQTTTIVGTGSITNRVHTKAAGAMTPGAISSSAFISPEIGLEPVSANYKVILERNLTGSIGASGSYAVVLEYTNNVLVAGGTDSYIGVGRISGYCLPGKGANAASASIMSYINNDTGMIPAISASYDGTLYQIWARHQGGASSSFAYTGTEWYHSGSTQ